MNETVEQPATFIPQSAYWTPVWNYVSFSVDTAMQAVMDYKNTGKTDEWLAMPCGDLIRTEGMYLPNADKDRRLQDRMRTTILTNGDVMIECWADYPIERSQQQEIYQRLHDELATITRRYSCRVKLFCWLNGTAIHDL